MSTQAILKAAGELLAESGPAGLSIDAIARRAKCGKPTVYRWWPDKLALLLDLHDAECEQSPLPPPADLPRHWDRQLSGTILRAAFAEAMASLQALHTCRRRVLARYPAGTRTILADWLLGEGTDDPMPAPDAPARTVSVRHVDEWVD